MCGAKTVQAEKACSGKCRGSCNAMAPRLWVIAACGGMVSLFRKTEGDLQVIPCGDGTVFSSLESFQSAMQQALERQEFDQLMIVGSGNDVAWLHRAMPEAVCARVIAEIQYPLLAGWFPNANELSRALKQVVLP